MKLPLIKGRYILRIVLMLVWIGGSTYPIHAQDTSIVPTDTLVPFQLIRQAHQWADSSQLDSSTHYYLLAANEYQRLLEIQEDSLLWVRYLSCQIWSGENERDLGNWDPAIQMGNTVLKEGRDLFGENHFVVAEAYDLLGMTRSLQGKNEQAIRDHLQSLKIYRHLFGEINEGVSDSYNNLARVYQDQGKYQEALKNSQRALEIQQQLFGEIDESLFISYSTLATIYTQLGDYQKALQYNEKALEVGLQIFPPTHSDLGSIYNNLAVLYFRQEQYDQAITAQKRTLDIKRNAYGETHFEVALSYANLGAGYWAKGDYPQALAYLYKGSNLFEELLGSSHPTLASIYTNIGVMHRNMGNHEEALTYQLKAAKINEELLGNSHPDLAVVYHNLSNIYIDKGDYHEAFKYMNKSLQIHLAVYGEEHLETSGSYYNLALIAQKQKKYGLAEKYVLSALKTREKFLGGENYRVANVYNTLGGLSWDKNDPKSARKYWEKALKIRQKVLEENHPSIAESYVDLAKSDKAAGNYSQAVIKSQQALSIYIHAFSELHPKVAKVYINLAEIYAQQGREDLVWSTYTKALAANVEDFQPSHKFDLPGKGNTVRDEITTVEILVSMAQYLQQHGENPDYLAATDSCLQYAIYLIDQARSSFHNESSQLSLQDLVLPVYESAIRTCFERYGQTAASDFLYRAYQYMEYSKAAILHQAVRASDAQQILGVPDELLALERQTGLYLAYLEGELNKRLESGETEENVSDFRQKLWKFQQTDDSLQQIFAREYPEYFRLKYQNQVAAISEIQASLPDEHTLLVEYFWGTQDMYVIAFNKNQFFSHQIPIDSTLLQVLANVRTVISDGETVYQESKHSPQLQQFGRSSFEIYRKMLKPVLEAYEDIQQLIIVPDGKLNYVPFEVLLTSSPQPGVLFKRLPYLFRDFSLSYEYSGTLLSLNSLDTATEYAAYGGFAPNYLNQLEGAGRERENDLLGSRSLQLSALKYNQEEIQGVANLMEGDAFLASMATEGEFKAHAGQYKILHLAMHAYTDDTKPQFSCLAFSSHADTTEDGLLHAYELYNMSIPAELTVLSACRTGLGELARGEGMMSLARAFRYAGCPSIVTSLWQANDPTTQKLMVLFFQHLKAGKNKSEALRQAKLDFLDHATLIEAHPFHWAPFVLIGDAEPVEKGGNLPAIWMLVGLGVVVFLGGIFLLKKHAFS